EHIQDGGRDALAVEADVSDPGQVQAMFERLDSEWGGLDILVNNAGIQGQRTPSWEINPDDWRGIVDVNLFGTFLCSREALQRMVLAESGVILNITSVHELIPWSGYSAYTASKAGVAMLTKTLAQEAAPHGVRVLALAPGAIKTPINRDVWQDPEQREQLLTKIPVNRIGEPKDIADMAVVLVSGAADYVTGTTVYVDGGMTDYPDFAHGG
ncbi:MAG: SDR family oxidoreductase, partial [Anaerolineales bacterium]|nr:SDR family oxidoreductase [Anaerolineales bacterium]